MRRSQRMRIVSGVLAVLFGVMGCNDVLGIHELDDDAGAADSGSEASKDGAVDAPGDVMDGGDAATPTAPRPIAPLSTSRVTSQKPTLRWQLFAGMDGARIEICKDRACTNVLQTVDVTGSSATPTSALSAGVYFWRLHARSASTVGSTTSVTWEFTVGTLSAAIDTSWGTMLDVNGDGYADLAVGAWGVNSNTGKVYVYLGGSSGISTTPTPIDVSGTGDFGFSVASAGDVNGDGYADLLVGASFTNGGTGSAYVFFGSASGVSTTPATTLSGAQIDHFGEAVASAGDVNGDGYADVVIGAPDANQKGNAYVFLGSASGVSTTPVWTASGQVTGDNFGDAVASADVNGDGHTDLIVGANGQSSTTHTGSAYVFLGTSSNINTTPATTFAAAAPNDNFGNAAASAGDVNGDGCADVVIGAYQSGTGGAAYLYLGGTSGVASSASVTFTTTDANGFLGMATGGGDVNGDGYDDVLVGEPGSASGKVNVYFGGSGGPSATTSQTLLGPDASGGEFGNTLGAVDVNRDGYADLASGAWALTTQTGKAYVMLSGSSGVMSGALTNLSAQDGTNGNFGYSVTGAGY